MRIIAALHRGRVILPPPGRTTRPITDRVKESLFSILTGQIREARVADIFAGTGSLGLEALSRGASFCCFVERDRHALRLLKQNIQTLGLEQQSQVASKNAWHFSRWFVATEPLDLIFLDPPYADSRDCTANSDLGKLLTGLCQGQTLSPQATIILRHEAVSTPAKNYGNLELIQSRSYGAMGLSFFELVSRTE